VTASLNPDVALAASLWSISPHERGAIARSLADDGIRRFHWDFSDGVFAAPGGTSPQQAHEITLQTGTFAEAHLMVTDPLDHIAAWAPFCDRITVHVEANDWIAAVEQINTLGCQAAVAVSPGGLLPDPLPSTVRGVLAMSVIPGQGGSTFDARAFDVTDVTPDLLLRGIDGGVTRSVVRELLAHGVTWIVCGTDLIRAEGVAEWARDAGLALEA